MAGASYAQSLSLGGLAIQKTLTRDFDHANTYGPITIPAGQAGTLSTRTDNDTGTITMTSGGHTITTGNTVDIHWTVSGVSGVRYGVTVGTVSGTSVPFDLGAGDNLPAQGSAVVITTRTQVNTMIDGDNVVILGVLFSSTDRNSTTRAHIDFQDSGNASIEELDFDANQIRIWDIEGGDTNVFTGNPITQAYASNGSSTEALTLYVLVGEDSTP